jgi:hypothetical protein
MQPHPLLASPPYQLLLSTPSTCPQHLVHPPSSEN